MLHSEREATELIGLLNHFVAPDCKWRNECKIGARNYVWSLGQAH